jgi:hypothetical protein
MSNLENAANEEHVKEKSKKERSEFDRDNADLIFLLNHIQFKRFIWKFLEFTNVNGDPFNPNSAIMARNVGTGNAGRYVMAKINDANPKALITMKEEVTKNV